jgi:peroxiredoxin
MKKRTIILCCLAAAFLFLLGASGFRMKKKYDFRRTIAILPDFCLPQATDSVLFCNTQLKKGKPVVLMYFHSECDYCHVKAQQLQLKSEDMGDVQWVLVSYAEKDSLNKFVATYNLGDISSLVVLMDSQFSLYDCLQVPSIPTNYIYDRRHQLVAAKQKNAKLETIIRLANR